MNYYSSDLHANHEILLNIRGFSSLEDMNNAIFDPIYGLEEDDDYYCVGDFAFGNKSESLARLAGAKCRKHLIWGNHDSFAVRNCNIWTTSQQYAEIKDGTVGIVLFHFPIMDWNRKKYGAIHLHGHMHSDSIYGNRADVGLDNPAWGFKPSNIETILAAMKDKEDVPTYGHH